MGKEEERSALNKIRTIVESLGENSGIAIAFENVLGYAERNIEHGLETGLYNEFKAMCGLYEETKEELEALRTRINNSNQ